MSGKSTDEIRETFLEFFAARGHMRRESASLVPATFDASVLLTTAGMHPLKGYFLGLETPPSQRLTSCQKCFRTTDIENVGNTSRHLTFFEMLGNFSIGDYFKQGAVEYAWELSLEGFGFTPQDIWITVFEGDEELGLGPDEEAIAAWESVGVPRERIVLCPRSENFWQSGPTGPCGPCSELYLDRGVEHGSPDDLPGGENERFLEYWNLVFMQLDQDPPGRLTPLPAQNIDTGLGLNRMALIQQGVETIFETDQFVPLMDLGRELSTRGADDERALRILADHSRAMTFLIGDGVVPSNEERGYILRRVMRRAIQQGHRIGIEGVFLPAFAEQVIEIMGPAYPDLVSARDTILKWVRGEEEGFRRTLEQGTKLLDDLLDAGAVSAADAFRLHDTFGFPIELTREMALERGVPFAEDAEFTRLMDEQRARSSAAAGAGRKVGRVGEIVREVAPEQTVFTGYEDLEVHTVVQGVREEDGRTYLKLAESPFYAAGGGQVSDLGTLTAEDGGSPVHVADVVRAGDDQALVIDSGTLQAGQRVVATVDRGARHATACNHTATHLLHAALRARLGDHVRQAGSYVGPDKLRFDFTHTERLSDEDRRVVEDEVNRLILEDLAVRPLTTTLDEARRLGAMALFGEKYGDIVRMVEIGDGEVSRELCGGTHVRSTSEIALLKITSEGSSAANVRRIEAITGPAAVRMMREHDLLLREAAEALRTPVERLPQAVVELRDRAKQAARAGGGSNGHVETADLLSGAQDVHGAQVLTALIDGADPKVLMETADRLKGRLGDQAAIVLGSGADGRVHLVAAVTPALVERGVRAGAIVKAAAEVAGGGGGGRDTMAQAGGRDPAKLPAALAAARSAIETALSA